MCLFCCRQGEQIAIYDGRPNTEMFLATGTLEEENLSDCLTVKANLVAADKLYMLKKQVMPTSCCSPAILPKMAQVCWNLCLEMIAVLRTRLLT